MTRLIRAAMLLTIALAASAPPAVSAPAAFDDSAPFWTGSPDVERFTATERARLARAKEIVAGIKAFKGKRTIENTLEPFDETFRHLANAALQAGLVENVHPSAAHRKAAEQLRREISGYWTELSLDRDLYGALRKVDASKADDATRYYVERELRDFRLAGVDRDDKTRGRIKVISDDLVEIGQDFARNIREDIRKIEVKDSSELAGLPQDYIDRHRPNAAGVIVITTQNPDAIPVLSYAKSDDLRKRLLTEYQNRAYPANMTVLNQMIAKRHELATLLGFADFADFITADKMAGSGKAASDFVDGVVAAARPIGDREYQQLLARKRQDDPTATEVTVWQRSYVAELVRKAEYDFDAQSVRPYFPYARVKQGVLDVTGRLFGVEFRRVENASVWHPSVECYEMFDGGTLRGRFYLDMHPRENKYSHAAHFGIRTGIRGKQLPEAVLVCNFPGGEAGDPGLMEHGQVQTFFHEFGHLLHNLFAGDNRWGGVSGISAERDFSEAPSQMLEEWTWDPGVLQSFARHHETGEPIPTELVRNMRRADEFGKGLDVLRQMVFARLSLSIYDRDPAQVDTDRMVESITAEYVPFKHMAGTHFQCNFGHLFGYSAMYYTYMWSLVIAKDMYSAFDPNNLFEPTVARRYRDRVLGPGSSKPAAKLVEDFLGRPFDNKAWKRWLESSEETSALREQGR
jgi:thimet oligopeptidase